MGRLLVLEGLDGSGKSTQTERLREALLAAGETVRQIKLPDYDAPSSTLVRQYLAGDFGNDPQAVNAYAASSFYAVDRVASFLLDWKPVHDLEPHLPDDEAPERRVGRLPHLGRRL